jgi:hypothetical protein
MWHHRRLGCSGLIGAVYFSFEARLQIRVICCMHVDVACASVVKIVMFVSMCREVEVVAPRSGAW